MPGRGAETETQSGTSLDPDARYRVNPVETYIRAGTYPRKPELPYTPGNDGAGVVEEVGRGVTEFRPGDRVYTLGQSAVPTASWRSVTQSKCIRYLLMFRHRQRGEHPCCAYRWFGERHLASGDRQRAAAGGGAAGASSTDEPGSIRERFVVMPNLKSWKAETLKPKRSEWGERQARFQAGLAQPRG